MKSPTIGIPSQHGRLAVVTGTGGIGYYAARELARAGAEVVMAGRNASKGAEAVGSIKAEVENAAVRFEQMDLASLSSVASFVDRLQRAGQPVDLLINNAGIMSPPQRETTADGFELQFGVNYLGHFALTLGLLPLLRASDASRVVSVTSLAHRYSQMDLDDPQNERRYQAGVVYCQSKLACALFAIELDKRSKAAGWGLQSMAAHPGFAATNLFQNPQGGMSMLNRICTRIVIPLVGQSGHAGAWPIIHAATSIEATSGNLYGPRGFMEMSGAPGRCNFAKHAHDPETAARLWSESEKLTGLNLTRHALKAMA
ncbi:MAG: SDR family oxidoreductase [Novosphingobium sp.]